MADRKKPAENGEPAHEWAVGWEAHRRRQLTFAASASPAERLRWLEEMIQIAFSTGALPKRRLQD